jgi:hypothetical protein
MVSVATVNLQGYYNLVSMFWVIHLKVLEINPLLGAAAHFPTYLKYFEVKKGLNVLNDSSNILVTAPMFKDH